MCITVGTLCMHHVLMNTPVSTDSIDTHSCIDRLRRHTLLYRQTPSTHTPVYTHSCIDRLRRHTLLYRQTPSTHTPVSTDSVDTHSCIDRLRRHTLLYRQTPSTHTPVSTDSVDTHSCIYRLNRHTLSEVWHSLKLDKIIRWNFTAFKGNNTGVGETQKQFLHFNKQLPWKY